MESMKARPKRVLGRAAAQAAHPRESLHEDRARDKPELPRVKQSAERMTRRSFFKPRRPGQTSEDSRVERIEMDEAGWADRY
jgi:hypothetical protein